MRHADNLPPLSPRPASPPRRRQLGGLRASFLTGLAVMLPIAVTIWLFWSLTGWIDSWVMPMVPMRWHPDRWLGVNPRGVGVVIFLAFTVLVGWIAKGWIGRLVLRSGERLVDRMPIVRSVYGGLKQISETLLAQGDEKFDRACLIEYPRKGIWGVGFVAGPAKGEVANLAPQGSRMMAVFVPTTPNPTSGFLLYVPEADLTYLDMSVEDAAKLIISGGLVYPPANATEPLAAANATAPAAGAGQP